MVRIFFCIRPGAFDDPEVTHVEDTVDPIRDLDIITQELRLKVICSTFALQFLWVCHHFELQCVFWFNAFEYYYWDLCLYVWSLL